MPICSKKACQDRARAAVTKAGDESAEAYWARVRATQLPHFWNSIVTRRTQRMSDSELDTEIAKAGGDPSALAALVRRGDTKEVLRARCEACNDAITDM